MDGKPLIEEGKNKEAQWAALCAVFLAVMEKLNSGKSPCIWVSTDSWAVSTGLALGSGRWAMESWTIKKCLQGAWFSGYHSWNLRDELK